MAVQYKLELIAFKLLVLPQPQEHAPLRVVNGTIRSGPNQPEHETNLKL